MTYARILAIGGSTRPDSSSERAVRAVGRAAEAAGAEVTYLVGRDLLFPIYDTETAERTPEAQRFIESVRRADGLIIASPAYHGGISGMIKNALDYIEDLNRDPRVYLDGMAVGCVAVAYGWQATVTTLTQIRQVVHALRGWPTPLGASVNAAHTKFDSAGNTEDESAATTLELVGRQVAEFAHMRHVFNASR